MVKCSEKSLYKLAHYTLNLQPEKRHPSAKVKHSNLTTTFSSNKGPTQPTTIKTENSPERSFAALEQTHDSAGSIQEARVLT